MLCLNDWLHIPIHMFWIRVSMENWLCHAVSVWVCVCVYILLNWFIIIYVYLSHICSNITKTMPTIWDRVLSMCYLIHLPFFLFHYHHSFILYFYFVPISIGNVFYYNFCFIISRILLSFPTFTNCLTCDRFVKVSFIFFALFCLSFFNLNSIFYCFHEFVATLAVSEYACTLDVRFHFHFFFFTN